VITHNSAVVTNIRDLKKKKKNPAEIALPSDLELFKVCPVYGYSL
jgi:hypothetical protein